MDIGHGTLVTSSGGYKDKENMRMTLSKSTRGYATDGADASS